MPDNTKITQNRIDGLVTLPGTGLVGGEFQTFSGGEVTSSDTIRDRDVGSQFDTPVPGTATVGDITVTRTWKTDRDSSLLKQLSWNVNMAEGTVSRVLRDLKMNRAGLDTYKVLLTGVTGPEGDTNGNNKGMLSLTFACFGPPS